jgi:type I restriction enzyme, S subunit
MVIINTKFSEIAKSHYLFSTFNFFRLRKKIDEDLFYLQVRLSDYFEIISGFAFSSKDYTDDGVSVCRIGDISKYNELLIDEMLLLPEEYADDYSKYRIQNNDILIGLTGDGKFFKTCYVENLEFPVLLNQRVGIIRVKPNVKNISAKFVSLLFNSNKIQNQIRIVAMGKTQKNVSPFDVLNIKIPKVELTKQNKLLQLIQPIETEIIIFKNSKQKPLDIINQVFGEEFGFDWEMYKDFGKGMTAGTQQSRPREKSIYIVKFSEIQKSNIFRISSRFHNPKTQFLNNILFSKPNIKVKDVVAEIVKGVQPEYDTEGDIPVVKITNLKNSHIDLENPELVSQSFYDKLDNKRKLQKNDVIICCTGKVSLGKVDLYEIEDDAVLTVDNYIIRLKENYNPLFFVYFFRSILGVFQIERDYTGATNQIHLYEKQIIDFVIPNFSLNKQAEIVEKIKSQIDAQNSIDHQIEQKQQQINQLIENAIKTV